MTPDNSRNPVADRYLRQPGQSLREKSWDDYMDTALVPVMFALCLFVAAMFTWIQFFFPTGLLAPVLVTICFLVMIPIAIVRYKKGIRQVRLNRLGREGEMAVGQLLDKELLKSGNCVLHDIPGERWNLDHVVVGPNGIFCIETKTRTKTGNEKVTYDGEHITVGGHTPDRDPVVQVSAGATWLSNLILESTGKRFPVQAVVVFPGWFVESKVRYPKVWVQNEKYLISAIHSNKATMVDTDIALVSFHLSRYIIAKTKELEAAKS